METQPVVLDLVLAVRFPQPYTENPDGKLCLTNVAEYIVKILQCVVFL